MTVDSTRAPERATAFTTTASMAAPDADIIAGFEKRRAAHDAYKRLPGHEPTADDRPFWNEIDQVEVFLVRAEAQTSRGVEAQLWAALTHLVGDPECDERSYRADLQYFISIERNLEWPARLVLAAIRSLRAMGGAA